MAITLGSFTFNTLIEQPFGFEELEAYSGLSARAWRVSGLCTRAQWAQIITTYETWRAARITDEDTLKSRALGTTVSFTGIAAGLAWTNLPCWFLAAPAAQQTGAYHSVTFDIVDAAQYLAALLAQEEKRKQRSEALLPDLGQLTLSYEGHTAVLTLTKPPESYSNAPSVQLTAAGRPYISGPLNATRVRDVEGTCNITNWTALQSWYEAIVRATPAAGTYYPTTPPSASATAEIVNGVKTTEYSVTLQLTQL